MLYLLVKERTFLGKLYNKVYKQAMNQYKYVLNPGDD